MTAKRITLHPRSEKLLRYLVSLLPLGVCRITTMPDGLNNSMANMRGLERAGLVKEEKNIFFATEEGKQWTEEHPLNPSRG